LRKRVFKFPMEDRQSNFIATFLEPARKRWLWTVVIVIAVFMVIKEASKFTENSSNKIDKKKAAAWPELAISESTSDDTHFYGILGKRKIVVK